MSPASSSLARSRAFRGWKACRRRSPRLEGNALERGRRPGRSRGRATGADGLSRGSVGVPRSFSSLRARCHDAIAAARRLQGRGALLKILISDDELISRRLLQKTLERAGYEGTA